MAQFPPVTAADFSVQPVPYAAVQNDVYPSVAEHQFTPNFLQQTFSRKLVVPVHPELWGNQVYRIMYGFAWSLFTTNVMIAWYILAAAHNFNPTWDDYDGSQILPTYVPREFYESLDMPPPPELPFASPDDNPLLVTGSYDLLADLVEKQQRLGLRGLAWIEKMRDRCRERYDTNWMWPTDPYSLPVPTEPVPTPVIAPNPARALRRQVPPDMAGWGTRYDGLNIYPPRSPPTFDCISSWATQVETPWDQFEEPQYGPPSIVKPRGALIVDDTRPWPEVIDVQHPSPAPSPTISDDYITAPEDTPPTGPVPSPYSITITTDAASEGHALILHPVHSSIAKAYRAKAIAQGNPDVPLTADEYAFIYEGLDLDRELDSA
ncbi:hypothetical protein BD410DRAFT_846851 [Rickenella mellea]|uniref:Uncharacterized protein n=1 Tax=Rickenella mellea TaxID=50990 RepID=A0A4Y7PDW6_9AGAM|nr:hypothetical protein BD410DRAFT_846851 [Rickenella mellea]